MNFASDNTAGAHPDILAAIVAAAAWLVYSWCKGRLRNEELYADENRAVNQRSSNVSGGGTMRDLFFGGAGPSRGSSSPRTGPTTSRTRSSR